MNLQKSRTILQMFQTGEIRRISLPLTGKEIFFLQEYAVFLQINQ